MKAKMEFPDGVWRFHAEEGSTSSEYELRHFTPHQLSHETKKI